MSKALVTRLERLAARESPHSPRVLKILVTRIGRPDYTVELVLDEPHNRRLGFSPGSRESDR
jgi:hypothetical protein